ncbi:unnamed protein product [Cylindrotheca closterium]|uniref:Uncharacterized protein n=1 Tax=Cylindrotheca closterium TaxID=2856 RepID=A0AAD2GB90_9STRA|nr:unnamed protein product [Cylindrotheca closterium]
MAQQQKQQRQQQQRQQHAPRRTSTSSDNGTNSSGSSSAFDVLQKLFLDPISACYAEDAYNMVEDSNTKEWSIESSSAGIKSPSRSLDSYYYGEEGEQEEDEDEDDLPLNGLIDESMSHTKSIKSSRTSSTKSSASSTEMAREHSSSSRHSSAYGIPILRDLPSFPTSSHSNASGFSSPARYNISTSRSMASEVSSLMSEYETKLPNINTMRKPINPAMLP